MNVRFQLLLVASALNLCVLQGCNIKTATSPPATSTSSVVRNDDNYVLALSSANEFLSAWRNRHQDKGIAMLTPSLLKAKGEQWWRDEISGISNPHQEAYEITNAALWQTDVTFSTCGFTNTTRAMSAVAGQKARRFTLG